MKYRYLRYGYYRRYRKNSNFEITKREVLFSIVIISLMFLIGFVISDKINNSLMEDYQKYNTALQIQEDKSQFEYGMKTNIGNAFIYGDLKAVDTVSYPEIEGEYSYIKKIKEKYTRHTRTVHYTDSNGKSHTKTEVYWTWDEVDSEEIHCNTISFLNIEFDYNKITLPDYSYIDTIKESSKIRYKYYGTGIEFIGTLYTTLENNTISNSNFYNNLNIEDTINKLESGWELIVFWILWIILVVVIVFIFYYFDNKWLEDNNK